MAFTKQQSESLLRLAKAEAEIRENVMSASEKAIGLGRVSANIELLQAVLV